MSWPLRESFAIHPFHKSILVLALLALAGCNSASHINEPGVMHFKEKARYYRGAIILAKTPQERLTILSEIHDDFIRNKESIRYSLAAWSYSQMRFLTKEDLESYLAGASVEPISMSIRVLWLDAHQRTLTPISEIYFPATNDKELLRQAIAIMVRH